MNIDMSELVLTRKNDENHKTIIDINGKKIGDGNFTLMAGPGSIDFSDNLSDTAYEISNFGISFFRGGAYKPRTSPYSFQGHKVDGLKRLKDIAKKNKLNIVTEVLDIRDIEVVADFADIIQVGARNMQNFTLLQELGKVDKPILLKRGFANTVSELLHSAEYILNAGNKNVILCERGIRTFEPSTRNTLDISAIPLLKQVTHLPVIVDPSHAVGVASLVPAVTKAILAVGADGAIIEAYSNPEKALSDKEQTISTKTLLALHKDLVKIGKAMNVTIQ